MPPRRDGPRIDALIIDNETDSIVESKGGANVNGDAVPDRAGWMLVRAGHPNN